MEFFKLFKNPSAFYKPELTPKNLKHTEKAMIYVLFAPAPFI